jgi:PAS domain S-box-containing protein
MGCIGLIIFSKFKQKQEQRLVESEWKFRTVSESANDWEYWLSENRQIVYMSPSSEKITGYGPQEFMNNPDLLTNIIHPEDRPLFLNHIKSLQDASHEGMELKIVSKSGQIRWLAHICSPLYMQHKFLGRRISNRDITDRKNAEEELRKYREHLEELVEQRTAELKKMADELTRSNKDLKEFAYVVSHDLKEPLQVIKGFLMLFEKRYKDKLDEKANEIIRFTVDGAKRMQELIKDLLEYSQVGNRGKEFKPTDCSLILNKAISNLKVSIEESRAVVTHDTLPMVMADAIQLSSLFQNLIGNAIKFHGSEAPMVHISTERKGDEWLFSVRDNGIGIDPKFADRIFAVFQRMHSSDEYPGTGIGLAICKKIVEHHGGRIWVESEPGKGATFYFTIPERQANT